MKDYWLHDVVSIQRSVRGNLGSKLRSVFFYPVVAQGIDALFGDYGAWYSILAAARLGHRLSACPYRNSQQLKCQFDAVCAINGSGGSLSLFYWLYGHPPSIANPWSKQKSQLTKNYKGWCGVTLEKNDKRLTTMVL